MQPVLLLICFISIITSSFYVYENELLQEDDKRVIIHFQHFSITMNPYKRSDSIPAPSNMSFDNTTVSQNVPIQQDSFQLISGYSPIPTTNCSQSPPSSLPAYPSTPSSQSISNNTVSHSESASSSPQTTSMDNRDGLRISVQTDGPYSLPNFGVYKYNRKL